MQIKPDEISSVLKKQIAAYRTKSINTDGEPEMAEEQTAAAKKKLKLTIITPRGLKFVEEADMIIIRTIEGNLGVLPGHAPLFTALGDGVLRIINNGSERHLAVFGGTAEINAQEVKILSTIAQRPEEIDLGRAEEDRRAAAEAMQEAQEEIITRRLQIQQIRALVRIHVGQADFSLDENSNGNSEDLDISGSDD